MRSVFKNLDHWTLDLGKIVFNIKNLSCNVYIIQQNKQTSKQKKKQQQQPLSSLQMSLNALFHPPISVFMCVSFLQVCCSLAVIYNALFQLSYLLSYRSHLKKAFYLLTHLDHLCEKQQHLSTRKDKEITILSP